MNQDLWMSLANNSAMLLALFVVYEISNLFFSKNRIGRELINGFLVSIICIVIMSIPFHLMPGIVFDTRTILISVTALVMGIIPTSITVIAALIYRIIEGGSGVYVGIATIITSASIGLIWRYFVKPQSGKLRWLNIYVMSLLVHLVMLLCMFLLPHPQSINVIRQISLPVITIYPATAVLLSLLLIRQQERKSYQEDLVISEEKYRNITENITDIIWTMDLNFHTTYISPSAEKLFGAPLELHMEKTLDEKLPPASIKKIKQILKEELKKEKEHGQDPYRTREVELEHYKTDGSIKWLSMNVSFLRDNSGNIIGFQGVSRDITERKLAEQALKASENKYHRYIDNAPDTIIVSDLFGKIVDVNKAACILTGYTKQELLNMPTSKLIVTDFDSLFAKYQETIKKDNYFHEELQFIKKDGNKGWASLDSTKIDKEHYINFINDISYKKQAEINLKLERDKAQTYLEVAKVIFIAFDTKFNVTLVNQEGCKILGLTKSEILGKNWITDFIPESHKKELEIWLNNILSGCEDDYLDHENPILCAGGHQRIVTWRNAILKDADGSITGILSSGTDVTELRSAVAALSESERSKSVFISHIPGIAYRCAYDRLWTIEFISDACTSLTGYTPEDLVQNKKLSFNDIICEKYREPVWEEWSRVIREKTLFKYEYEIQRADGETKWVFETGQPIYAADGSVEALEGIIIDIDESKQRYNQILYMNDHDFLTGLYNRRYFEEHKKKMDTKENLPLTIITADINGVRIINDAFGHKRGDELIVTTANILNRCNMPNAVLARTGGDEFNIIIANAGKTEAQKMIGCIREACADYNANIPAGSALINISLGYGLKENEDKTLDEALKEAEDHMLNHKLLDRKSHHNSIISSIMATMYARSQETEQHAERLAELSIMIGHELGLAQQRIDELQLVSMLHDIGKIGIDDSILNKPGPLTKDEWEVMKHHPEIGYRIAMSSPELESIALYILHHHERWDGTGYPAGLSGEQIPLLSRILSVVDAFDAMTKDRIYRKAMPESAAIAEIVNNAGTQFDPKIAEIFIRLVNKGK